MPETITLDIAAAVEQLFGVPALTLLAQAFSFGLVTPLTCYFVAYHVGVLVNFWRK